MTVYRDNYPNNIEAPQKLYIQYSHDISFDYSTGRYPDGTESEWHWESNYIPIAHKINGLDVGRHEWMKIRIGETNFWTYPIRMSANITNIQTIESEIDEGTGEFSFTIKLTFEDGSTKESDPITIKNGVDGVEITSAQINETGYLIITYSDGTVENAGRARGEDAEGLPVGPDGYILSTTGGGIPVWILPLQVVNAAISTNAPLSYNITNGQFTISQATTTTDGYLSSTDWNAFNDKMNTNGDNSNVDFLQFNTSQVSRVFGEGEMGWDVDEDTISFGLPDGGSIQIGKEQFDYYTNLSGTTLVDGDIVSSVTAPGNRKACTLTDCSNLSLSYGVLGMVTNGPILPNAVARITKFGEVHSLDTRYDYDLNELFEGPPIFVHPLHPGKWTNTRPSSAYYTVIIGAIANKHTTQGSITVNKQIIPKLEDLSNVDYTLLTTSGLVPIWNNVTKIWEPGLITSGGDMYLANIQSVTGLKTFDTEKLAVKGSSTGKNIIASLNDGASDYTHSLQKASGTLAHLADISNISYIDASIADSGGDYTSLADAQTAGKTKLKLSGNLTLGADFTLTSAMTIDLNGYTLNCGAYVITRSSGSLKIYCSSRIGNITFAYASAKVLFTSFTVSTLTIVDIGTITNNSSSDNTAIANYGYFRNILNVAIANKSYGGFTIGQGSYIENIKITGSGTGNCYVISATSCIISNVTLEGTYNAGFPTIGFITCTIDGIFCNNSNGVVIYNSSSKINGIIRITAQNITLVSGGVAQFSNSDFTIMSTGVGSYNYMINCNCKAAFNLASNNSSKLILVNCHFTSTFTIGAYANRDRWFISNCIFVGNATFPVANILSGSKISNCEFQGTFTCNADGMQIIANAMLSTSTLNADAMKVIGNIFTGAATLSAGSDNNTITENTFTAGLTDNSGTTTNIIKDNI